MVRTPRFNFQANLYNFSFFTYPIDVRTIREKLDDKSLEERPPIRKSIILFPEFSFCFVPP